MGTYVLENSYQHPSLLSINNSLIINYNSNYIITIVDIFLYKLILRFFMFQPIDSSNGQPIESLTGQSSAASEVKDSSGTANKENVTETTIGNIKDRALQSLEEQKSVEPAKKKITLKAGPVSKEEMERLGNFMKRRQIETKLVKELQEPPFGLTKEAAKQEVERLSGQYKKEEHLLAYQSIELLRSRVELLKENLLFQNILGALSIEERSAENIIKILLQIDSAMTAEVFHQCMQELNKETVDSFYKGLQSLLYKQLVENALPSPQAATQPTEPKESKQTSVREEQVARPPAEQKSDELGVGRSETPLDSASATKASSTQNNNEKIEEQKKLIQALQKHPFACTESAANQEVEVLFAPYSAASASQILHILNNKIELFKKDPCFQEILRIIPKENHSPENMIKLLLHVDSSENAEELYRVIENTVNQKIEPLLPKDRTVFSKVGRGSSRIPLMKFRTEKMLGKSFCAELQKIPFGQLVINALMKQADVAPNPSQTEHKKYVKEEILLKKTLEGSPFWFMGTGATQAIQELLASVPDEYKDIPQYEILQALNRRVDILKNNKDMQEIVEMIPVHSYNAVLKLLLQIASPTDARVGRVNAELERLKWTLSTKTRQENIEKLEKASFGSLLSKLFFGISSFFTYRKKY